MRRLVSIKQKITMSEKSKFGDKPSFLTFVCWVIFELHKKPNRSCCLSLSGHPSRGLCCKSKTTLSPLRVFFCKNVAGLEIVIFRAFTSLEHEYPKLNPIPTTHQVSELWLKSSFEHHESYWGSNKSLLVKGTDAKPHFEARRWKLSGFISLHKIIFYWKNIA